MARGVAAEDGDEGLVGQLEPVRLAAQRGELEPGPLVVGRVEDERPDLQDPLPILHQPLAALSVRAQKDCIIKAFPPVTFYL